MMKRSHGCLYDSQCNYHDHEGAGHRWTSDSDEFGGRWICHQRRNIPHLSHWRARVVSIAGAVNGQDCERGESRSVGDRDTITVVGRHAAPRAERLVINGGACTVQQPGAHYSSRDGQHLSIMRSLLARGRRRNRRHRRRRRHGRRR